MKDDVRLKATYVDEVACDVEAMRLWRGHHVLRQVYEEDYETLVPFVEDEIQRAKKLVPTIEEYIYELEELVEMLKKEDSNE